MPGGLILLYIAVIAASPLSKQGIVIPLVLYISLTNIITLFRCFLIALNPLYRAKITGKNTT